MAASIVYEGVESQGGGRLFQGLKFWVAQRVPSRKMFLDMIQQNGGSVVPLEKNADMLFADHMRKDAPPGAYSWKWIEDSIKQGALQSKDSAIYLIGRSAQEPRTVASAEPTRGTRTPFTPADDSALIKWVLSQSDKEKGNKIYQDFEQIYHNQQWKTRKQQTSSPSWRLTGPVASGGTQITRPNSLFIHALHTGNGRKAIDA
ncbi:hypothetical protein ACHAQA_003375 [Verticillium albo-atrum]